MFHTLSLNILLLVTVFPGIIYMFIKKIIWFKYWPSFNVYLLTLFIVTLVNGIFFMPTSLLIQILLVIIILFLSITCELGSKTILWMKNLNNLMKIDLISVILYPFFEELTFRFFLLQIGTGLKYLSFQFVILSGAAFMMSHVIYQGRVGIKKIFLGLSLAIILVCTDNLFLVVLIHMLFNFIVYVNRNRKNTNW